MNAIMMSPANSLAIQENRKTQTRRTSKLKINKTPDSFILEDLIEDPPHMFGETGTYAYFHRIKKPYTQYIIKAPYEVGQIIYVRESWCLDDAMPYRHDATIGQKSFRVRYAGERQQQQHEIWMPTHRYENLTVMQSKGWKPSLFMPVEAARLFVRIKSIGIERLHDITDDDILAEGFSMHGENSVSYTEIGSKKYFDTALEGWKWLWKECRPGATYDVNLWVWKICFEKVEKPLS